jgi:hypothetical protein
MHIKYKLQMMTELSSNEKVTFKGMNGKTTVDTKVDSGAARTSIDHKLAGKIGAGPVVSSVKITNLDERRSVVKVWVEVKDIEKQLEVSLSDRQDRSTKAIIGRDLLEADGVSVNIDD